MPSKFLVPLEVPDFQGVPSSVADPGFVLTYIKYGWWTKHDGTSEIDLVLQRPLDGFTEVDRYANPVTASDTVLSAIEKIQRSLSTLKLQGDVTGTAAYVGGELIIDAEVAVQSALVATEFDSYHFGGYGTEYQVGDLVYYQGHIFRANFNNDGVTPSVGGNVYWTDLGAGNRLRQMLSDWNATTGEAQILNKPTNLSDFTNDLPATDRLVADSLQLILNADGTITFPYNQLNTGTTPLDMMSSEYVQMHWYAADNSAAGYVWLDASGFNIETDTTGGSFTWNFFEDTLTFPDGSFQTTAFTGEVDTLDSVTTRGNTTANGVKIDGNVDLVTAAGTTNVLRIGHTDTAVAFVDIRPSYAGPNIGLYVQNPGKTGTSYAFIAQAQQNNAATDNIAGYFNAQYGNTNTAIRTDYGNNLLNALGGNLLVGTTVDAGFKLDVNGWVRFGQDPTSGTTEFYPDGSGGANYSVFKSRLGSGLGPTLAFYGDVSGAYRAYGIYGPDISYDGLLIYNETTDGESALFGAEKIVFPYRQLLTWSATSLTFQTVDVGIARNDIGLLEINRGIANDYAMLKLKNAYVTDLSGSGDFMVFANDDGQLFGVTPYGLQDVLTNNSTLTLDNTLDFGGYNFTWNNVYKFILNTPTGYFQTTASDATQSATILATVHGGAIANVYLQANDALLNHDFRVSAAGIFIKPRGFSSATVGQALVLTDAATGEIRFQTVSGGGGGSYLTVNNPAYTGVLTTGTLTYTPANHVAALQLSVNSYNQFIIQNSNSGANASSDIVVNNNLSTDATYYGDFGINSSNFSGSSSFGLANAVYLAAASGDLVLGTYTNNAIRFVINSGSTDAVRINATTGGVFINSLAGTGTRVVTTDATGNLGASDLNTINGNSIIGTGNDVVLEMNRSKYGYEYFTDFLVTVISTNNTDGKGYHATFSGTGATIIAANAPSVRATNQIGYVQYQTGTTAPGYAGITANNQANNFYITGGGEMTVETSIFIPTLSTLTERYRFVFGYGNQVSNVNETSGIFFTYDEGGSANGAAASANWQCATVANSVRTYTTTSVAVSTTAWVKLKIVVNAEANSVDFYIDNTLVATHTTNIPSGTTQTIIPKQQLAKTVGTTTRSVYADYFGYRQIYTTVKT